MTVFEVVTIIAAVLGLAAVVLAVVILRKLSRGSDDSTDVLVTLKEELQRSQVEEGRRSSDHMGQLINAVFDRQDKRLDAMTQGLSDSLGGINKRFADYQLASEQKLENMRRSLEKSVRALQDDNNKQLEKMRETVDEKLQKTLEDKIGQSFRLVSERLEQVYKGLGEMQTLAAGVGDLKKVLSNVKTRGTLGEIQLEAILEQLLSPEQYEKQVSIKQGVAEKVDFAIKMPGDDGAFVYLPIDAKFPMDAYAELMDAYDTSDAAGIDAAAKVLETRIKVFAKDIHDKYINPPDTTDFAVLFLPVEGLYAEVVRRGISEELQRKHKITVAGPTNMAALLNSLQMGFRTLAIQKRSGEVWNVLGAVKTEFDKFGDTLAQAQRRIGQASEDLDHLIGTRTRQIQRKLREVSTLPSDQEAAQILLDDTPETE